MSNRKKYMKQWRKDNSEHIKEYDKKWKKDNLEHRKEYQEKWNKDNLEHIKKRRRQRYLKDREKELKQAKQWAKDNPERIKEIQQQYYYSNHEREVERVKQYRKDHLEERKEYEKQYKKNHTKEIKQRRNGKLQYVQDYKLSKGCQICGYNKNPGFLGFHHPNDDKEFNVSYACAQDLSLEKIKEEMAKCIILCANCHTKLHWKATKKNNLP